MTVRVKGILDALHPAVTRKRYTVDILGFAGGYFRSFWTLRKATEFYEAHRHSAPFASLVDEWRSGNGSSGLTLRSSHEKERFKVPPVGLSDYSGYMLMPQQPPR